jgi:hypothetical protein
VSASRFWSERIRPHSDMLAIGGLPITLRVSRRPRQPCEGAARARRPAGDQPDSDQAKDASSKSSVRERPGTEGSYRPTSSDGDATQLAIRIDGDGVPDRPEKRKIGVGVRVRD